MFGVIRCPALICWGMASALSAMNSQPCRCTPMRSPSDLNILIQTRSKSSLNSEWLASYCLALWVIAWPELNRTPVGLPLPPSSSRDAWNSRSISPLQAFLRLCASVIFIASGLLYAGASLVADRTYGVGMEKHCLPCFELAAKVFPLNRVRRTGPAVATAILKGDQPELVATAVRAVILTDVNAADLWYTLAQADLKLGDKQAYTADMVQLRKLTPHVVYRAVLAPIKDLP